MTKEQIESALKILAAMAGAIKDLKTVPSGVLYATLMAKLSLDEYEAAIQQLVNTGLIEVKNHLIVWTGK